MKKFYIVATVFMASVSTCTPAYANEAPEYSVNGGGQPLTLDDAQSSC